uniref:hypothetical protein n=1 Tax=Thaumasiovibrio occultus TaxID=1891184 RepID=UPI000B35DA29|nr:hypothetical protein [Thaumasiovibrio occultus]
MMEMSTMTVVELPGFAPSPTQQITQTTMGEHRWLHLGSADQSELYCVINYDTAAQTVVGIYDEPAASKVIHAVQAFKIAALAAILREQAVVITTHHQEEARAFWFARLSQALRDPAESVLHYPAVVDLTVPMVTPAQLFVRFKRSQAQRGHFVLSRYTTSTI